MVGQKLALALLVCGASFVEAVQKNYKKNFGNLSKQDSRSPYLQNDCSEKCQTFSSKAGGWKSLNFLIKVSSAEKKLKPSRQLHVQS